MSVIPDSEFGSRVRRRLGSEKVAWLTTTGADGTPQPNPVWFVWEQDADALIVYSDKDAARLEHVAARPRVAVNFDGDGRGGDIVVIAGVAEQALDAPPPDRHVLYVSKYAADVERIGMDPASFAERYSVPLRVRMTKVRGH